MKTLENLGWNKFYEDQFHDYKTSGFSAGRISIEYKERYMVFTEIGELPGEISGKLYYSTDNSGDFPKVGDWVVISIFKEESKVVIHEILRRRNKLSRKDPGRKTEEQVLASNIDFICIVQGLDGNYNLRRLERYIAMVYESEAEPVIILNKSDLDNDHIQKLREIRRLFPEIKCFATSSIKNTGLEALKEVMKPGKTFAFIGSSGVGKSTIINSLNGNNTFKTQEVRIKDSRGKHTTTHRQLIILENGGMLIDTPGMRGLELWKTSSGLDKTFNEIEDLAEGCHFSDCTHTTEIKCAVIDALNEGKISEERYKNYLKLQKELRYLETKQSKLSYLESKKKMKILSKTIKDFYKRKN